MTVLAERPDCFATLANASVFFMPCSTSARTSSYVCRPMSPWAGFLVAAPLADAPFVEVAMPKECHMSQRPVAVK